MVVVDCSSVVIYNYLPLPIRSSMTPPCITLYKRFDSAVVKRFLLRFVIHRMPHVTCCNFAIYARYVVAQTFLPLWLPTTLPHKAYFGTTRQRVHRRGVALIKKLRRQARKPNMLVNVQSRKESISKLGYSMRHFRAFSSTSRAALRPGISVVTKVAKGFGYFYLALTTIPIGLSCIAAYNYFVKRDDKHARGSLFYSWTGWLCLPLSLPVILAYPYVYFYDRYQRSFMDYIQKLWARTTTKYFFRTHVVGTKNISKLNGGPAVYISNHQSWLDAYALFGLMLPN